MDVYSCFASFLTNRKDKESLSLFLTKREPNCPPPDNNNNNSNTLQDIYTYTIDSIIIMKNILALLLKLLFLAVVVARRSSVDLQKEMGKFALFSLLSYMLAAETNDLYTDYCTSCIPIYSSCIKVA
jgi:hypothetical protein